MTARHSKLYLLIQHDEFESGKFRGLVICELLIEPNYSDLHFPARMVWTDFLQRNTGHPTYTIHKYQLECEIESNCAMRAEEVNIKQSCNVTTFLTCYMRKGEHRKNMEIANRASVQHVTVACIPKSYIDSKISL